MEVYWIISLVLAGVLNILVVIANWRLFEKAGRAGWESIIPIYNAVVLHKIVGKPVWWVVFYLIPGVNLLLGIWMSNLFAKSFGKDEWYTLGLVTLPAVFITMLAFGDAQYDPMFQEVEFSSERTN